MSSPSLCSSRLPIFMAATIPNFLSARQSLGHVAADRRIRLDRDRHDGRHAGRRHRSQRRLDLRARQFDRAGADQCREMADRSRHRGDGRSSARWSASINGLLIGFLRLRAFLTTLVMLTLMRAIVEFLLQIYSVRIASSDVESDLWDFVGSGSVLGVPFSFVVLIVVAIVAHVVLTRLRIGWRIVAVGGSRRAAYNAGIPVRAHGVPDLCRLRRADRACRHALCGAAFRRRPRHRPRPRTHGR